MISSGPYFVFGDFALFYVYAYLREDGSPYYVGKGSGNRAYAGSNRVTAKPKNASRIIFWHENLEEDEAFALEMFYIKLFGRKDNNTGILRNLTDGGEGTIGISEETRKKIQQATRENWKSEEYKLKCGGGPGGRFYPSNWKITKPDGLVIYTRGLKWFCKLHNLHSSNLAIRGYHKGWRAEKISGENNWQIMQKQ